MNDTFFRRYFPRLACAVGALCMTLIFCIPLHAQTNSRGEEFFIVSSVDQKTHQLVLMRPTQLTVAAKIGPETICTTEDGKKINASALRAGDTVWAVLRTAKDGTSIVRIREGAMTEADLRRLYLHYSTGAPSEALPAPVKPSPLNPPPQSGVTQSPASAGSPVGSNAMLHPRDARRRPQGPGSLTRGNS